MEKNENEVLFILEKKYGSPIPIENVDNFEDLVKIEIVEQEGVKRDPDFDISRYVKFERSEFANWPDCSILGNQAYKKDDMKRAYEIFYSIRRSSVNPVGLPTWSQGIYGMLLDCPEDDFECEVEKLHEHKGIGSGSLECCVGFDINYLPFFNVFNKSAHSANVKVNAILCYDNREQVDYVVSNIELENVNLYAIKTPPQFDFRTRKGFYTLSRYLLAKIIFEERSDFGGLVITDVDAVLLNFDKIFNYTNEQYDVGVLELKKPRRPWLKNTAPFLYVSRTKAGSSFIDGVGRRVGKIIKECVETEGVSLWGADQAVITSSLDWFLYRKEKIKVFNFIKSINFFMEQAQSVSKDKKNFLEKHS